MHSQRIAQHCYTIKLEHPRSLVFRFVSFRTDFVSSRIAPPPPLFLDILNIYLIQSYTIKILNSGLLTKKPFSSLVAWVAACPRTRLNHLYSLSALYTEVLERLRRGQLITGAQPKAGTGLKMQTVRFFNVTMLGIYRFLRYIAGSLKSYPPF